MRKAERIILIVLMLALCLPCGTALAFGGPTAIIVDDETGEPIEGAIALAQWVKYSATLFEGGVPYAAKAKETVSDKNGKIYISGYWSWNPFACERHLTVYKLGYALWNSEKEIIPVENPQPKNFSRYKKVVRLVKFEKAAEEWKKIGYSEFVKKYPRQKHSWFLSKCLELELDRNSISIIEVFRNYEMPFVRQEEAQKRREYENGKKK